MPVVRGSQCPSISFGEDDAFIIIEAPDSASAAAASLTASASGTVRASITVLITPEEMDEAGKKQVAYRPAGQ
jgi:uncharacterized protein with GYD domain